jgi:hypothetical protein
MQTTFSIETNYKCSKASQQENIYRFMCNKQNKKKKHLKKNNLFLK